MARITTAMAKRRLGVGSGYVVMVVGKKGLKRPNDSDDIGVLTK